MATASPSITTAATRALELGRCMASRACLRHKYDQFSGLKTVLRIHQPDYMSFIRRAGVIVSIHKPDKEPFIETFGLYAAPGLATSFGIKYVSVVCIATVVIMEFLYSSSLHACHNRMATAHRAERAVTTSMATTLLRAASKAVYR